MCGIAGLIEPTTPNGNALRQSILQMTEALTHRGPDSDGIWLDESLGVALGHRRLAIVDLSPTGQQPMVSSTGRYIITYNGEIYNFPELRRELEGKGC